MSEMMERVKRAIAEKLAPAIDLRAPYAKIMIAEAARSAIEVMIEPTEAMRLGAVTRSGVSPGIADVTWRAMIDAALISEPPSR